MDVARYLEYLDKEMTIMGILSAAAVAAPAAILNLSLSKDVRDMLWAPEHIFLVMGSTLCVIAALLFYKQRSTLAWYYGQITLAEALTETRSRDVRLRGWLRDADSWETWWPYCCAFTCLTAGFAEFLFAVFFLLASDRWSYLHVHLVTMKHDAFWLGPVAVALIAPFQAYVRIHYKYSDEAWADWRSDLLRRLRRRPALPHVGVYARLKPSAKHGVGVFAIVDIPEGAYVFEPDDGTTVSIARGEIEKAAPPLQKLYKDFCVLDGDNYICPSNFNQMTMSWYINHSSEPNVVPDESLKFYALRSINAGEELTSDYNTYSDEANDLSENPS
jgi:SET domain